MAGYRRFIAYVYEYRKGKKQNNCGFIKVEVRGNECVVEIHLHVEGLAEGETCKVYCFVRKEGLLHGILIGSCNTQKDWIECVLETDGTSIGGSGLPLDKMGGMILTTPSGGFYGTEWDDQVIRPENFKEVEAAAEERSMQEVETRETQQQKNLAEEEENVSPNDLAAEEVLTPQVTAVTEEPVNLVEKIAEPEPITEVKYKSESEYTQREKSPETKEKEEPNLKSEAILTEKSKVNPALESESMADPDIMAIPKAAAEANSSLNPENSILPETDQAVENKEGPEVSAELHIQSAKSKDASFSLPFGQSFCPFADGDLNQCWKITPQDLVHFPRRQCALRNNRFLQYGYYNFGHLLLCRRSNGRYILGVPGSYDQQEQFMAGMFGFSCFKESSQIKVKKGRGGYWYRAIDPPACW
ncbi:DUF6128 domain-containing protein [Blautia sp. Sow4_E7]|uniref:DUF6128 domain-containing protein n=1 Tax=Blautia sp. Sow4_E7 TaxID=3438749 RepID=UPI003F8F2E3E